MKGLERKGHIVTCNNFFTNPTLFWELLKDDIHAISTFKQIAKAGRML